MAPRIKEGRKVEEELGAREPLGVRSCVGGKQEIETESGCSLVAEHAPGTFNPECTPPIHTHTKETQASSQQTR